MAKSRVDQMRRERFLDIELGYQTSSWDIHESLADKITKGGAADSEDSDLRTEERFPDNDSQEDGQGRGRPDTWVELLYQTSSGDIHEGGLDTRSPRAGADNLKLRV